MLWYEDAMVFLVFIYFILFYFTFFFFTFFFFWSEPTVRKDIWMRAAFVTIMVTFQKCHSESYLITAMFKDHSQ